MKKIFLILLIAAGTFVSCDKTEAPIFDANEFDPGYTFVNIDESETILGNQSVQYLAVSVTKLSDQDQTFQIVLDEDATTAEPESFNLPAEIVIPANSYEGFVTIDYTIDGLPSVPRTIAFDYIVPEGITTLGTAPLSGTIDFEAVTVCDPGSVVFNLTTDDYGGETSWTLVDEDDNTIASGDGYASNTDITETIDLTAGCYTFTIFDSFGDGICCAYGRGSYDFSCGSGTELLSGGDFGAEESIFFCIN
jgi:hypothetical protein